MRKLITVLLIACLPLLTWNCQKEDVEKWNVIEGQISAGIDMSNENLAECPIVLGKIAYGLKVEIDVADPANMEWIKNAIPDENGSFSFDSLPDGEYVILAGEGFEFADSAFDKFDLKGNEVYILNKTIDRLPADNGSVNYSIRLKNDTDYSIESIVFSSGNVELKKVGPYNSNHDVDFSIRLNKKDDPTIIVTVKNGEEKIVSKKLDFFFSLATPFTYLKNRDGSKGYLEHLTLTKGWLFGHYITLDWETDFIY